MALKRLSRKEIVQEDRIHARLSQISQWVLRNRNYLAAAAVVLVVVIVGLWALQGYRAGQAAETQGLFSDALELYHATIDKVEEKSEEKVEGRGKGREIGPRKRLRLALKSWLTTDTDFNPIRNGSRKPKKLSFSWCRSIPTLNSEFYPATTLH